MIFSGLITCAKLQVCGNSLVFHRKALQEEYWDVVYWFNTGTTCIIALLV